MSRICAVVALSVISAFCDTQSPPAKQILPTEPIHYEVVPHLGFYYNEGKLSGEKTTTEFYIRGKAYDTKINAHPAFGVTGEWPWNEWISSYALATYQKMSVHYRDPDSDVDKSFYSHNLALQVGVEGSLTLFRNERAQIAFKLIGLGGFSGGYGFFTGSRFENPAVWGYAWGVGTRILWKRFSLASGVRNTHAYWHTYLPYETQSEKDDNSFMFDGNATAQPFFSLSIALF